MQGAERFHPWQALQADTYRQYGRFTWKGLVMGALTRRTFRIVVTMRLCQWAARARGMRHLVLPLCRLLHRMASHRAMVDLPWNTNIGPGLALTHGYGLVVSPGARIGGNVTLFHGVTLGRRDRVGPEGQRVTGFPVLEDEVWVGPHAIFIGGITVGRGSRIGGGAFVTDDVPPHSVVTGNPARITRGNCIPDVMHPAPVGKPALDPAACAEHGL
jgi:serine O-acetyltransferase